MQEPAEEKEDLSLENWPVHATESGCKSSSRVLGGEGCQELSSDMSCSLRPPDSRQRRLPNVPVSAHQAFSSASYLHSCL